MLIVCKFFVTLIVYGLIASSSWACHLKVHVVNYPPIAISPIVKTNTTGQWQGLNILYIDALFRAAKCSYTLYEIPFARGISLVQQGEMDLAINISKMPEREALMHFIGPQRIEEIVFVTRKSQFESITSWEQFKALEARLMWQTGAYFGEELANIVGNDNAFKSSVIYRADNITMIELIERDRADGYFVTKSYFNYQKKHNPKYQQLEAHPLVINYDSMYYAFSKRSVSDETLQIFERAFEQIQKMNIGKRVEATNF